MASTDTPALPLKEIRELPALLAAQLADGEEVEKFDVKPATSLGDNYGSTMLALDVVIRKASSPAGDERHLRAFCKMLPDDPMRRAVFSVEVTFVKELEMYTLALPAMLRLQQDSGVPEEDLISHLVPECYGGRVSLSSGGAVDDDAAILLEDMRQRGFAPGADRAVGLDLQHAKLVLEKLAVLHALGVALRNKRPQVYADTVERACRDFRMGGDGPDSPFDDLTKFNACILHNVKKSERAARHYDAVAKLCAESSLGREEKFPAIREPFATIFHNDLWTNNVLVRKDAAGEPQQAAFIDFQVTRINSPFKDVLFFLFSSVQPAACAAHLDELVALYHASFVRCLAQCGVDTEPFSLAAAWREIDALARTELFHVLFMLRWITADPATIRANPETFVFMLELGGEAYTSKVEHTVCMYAERGWLDA